MGDDSALAADCICMGKEPLHASWLSLPMSLRQKPSAALLTDGLTRTDLTGPHAGTAARSSGRSDRASIAARGAVPRVRHYAPPRRCAFRAHCAGICPVAVLASKSLACGNEFMRSKALRCRGWHIYNNREPYFLSLPCKVTPENKKGLWFRDMIVMTLFIFNSKFTTVL